MSSRALGLPVDGEADRLFVLGARVGEEDDGGLQTLGAVDGHQAHRSGPSGPGAHLFDVARVGEAIELRDDLAEIEAVGGESAGGGDGLQEVARAAVAELPRSRVRGPAEPRADPSDRRARRQLPGQRFAVAQDLARERDAQIRALGRRGAEREAPAGAEVAVQGFVVDAEERTAEDGGECHRVVGIGDRGERRQERLELLRVFERSTARELVGMPRASRARAYSDMNLRVRKSTRKSSGRVSAFRTAT